MLLLMVVAGGIFAYGYFVVHKHDGPPPKPSLQQLKAWQFELPQITANTAGGGVAQLTVVFQAGNAASLSLLKLAQTQLSSLLVSTLLTIPGKELKTVQGEKILEHVLLDKAKALLPTSSLLSVEIPQMIVQ